METLSKSKQEQLGLRKRSFTNNKANPTPVMPYTSSHENQLTVQKPDQLLTTSSNPSSVTANKNSVNPSTFWDNLMSKQQSNTEKSVVSKDNANGSFGYSQNRTGLPGLSNQSGYTVKNSASNKNSLSYTKTNSSVLNSGTGTNYLGYKVSSNYGTRNDPFTGKSTNHSGLDLAMPTGTKLTATTGGTVIASGTYGKGSGYNNYGNVVAIRDNSGNTHLFAHMDKTNVKVGQKVNAGQLVGYSGNTGRSTGAHLHYEVRKNGQLGNTLNPLNYLKSSNSTAKSSTGSTSKSTSTKVNANKYMSSGLGNLFNSASQKYGVSNKILLGVAYQESTLGKYSKNVMQVNGVKDTTTSVNTGAKMLSNYLKQTGDLRVSLAMYNMGAGIKSWFNKYSGGKYSQKVMQDFSNYQKKKNGYRVYGDTNYVEKIISHMNKFN